jgi:hypothetical protein
MQYSNHPRNAEYRQGKALRLYVLLSVYGVSGGDFMNEESPVDPLAAYAVCKTLVERDVKGPADGRFCPVTLRSGNEERG